ncbi:helix-turn-helix domain-containing protein [Gordonia tangerina]|uniref:Helix-turn-helix domain-containing protein n=1 Tax=Gordonia tangerina TaxID=2911060 RepID=A0ABS9DPT9_9ACTN|nr:helix-turn-helix transcriptional regulator [Gordonia tangerina]MCF3939961.1 helix-turn-helix domain-containing protein [Gordonia tangerina]
MTESYWEYLVRITDGASGVAISRAAQVDAGNISRWKSGKTRPSAEAVVKIARVWKRPPVEALVAAGYLTANEAGGTVEIAQSIADLGDDELLTEIRKRMEARHGVEATQESNAPGEEDQDQKSGLDQAQDAAGDLAAGLFSDQPLEVDRQRK